MGTRGVIGWKLNGEYTFLYNHFDSYLDYLGIRMLILCGSITANNEWGTFKENVSNLTIIKKNEYDKVTNKKLLAKYEKYRDTDINGDEENNPTYYSLFRKLQGTYYITEILNGNLKHILPNNDFIYDSTFCEYAYTFNLDTMKLEFWKGFQRKPNKSNPLGSTKVDGEYPCKRIKSIPFKDITQALVEYSLFENVDMMSKVEDERPHPELMNGDSKLAVMIRTIDYAYDKDRALQKR
jgi:hypothetical protein